MFSKFDKLFDKAIRLLAVCIVFWAALFFSVTVHAKPDKVTGHCRGPGCEIVAVEGIRTLRKSPNGSLKAYFVVYGFDADGGSSVEWSDDTHVEWVFCSETTPLIMGFGIKGFSSNAQFYASEINYGDNLTMALVTPTNIYQHVCGELGFKEERIDKIRLGKLIERIKAPFDVFDE
jgi:hypothetical protein